MSRHLKGRSGIGGQVPIEIEKRQSLYAESISAELSRKRQFWKFECQAGKAIIFVFPVFGFFVAKLSLEIQNCRIKQ